jgi:hypothetical protein
VAINDVDVQYFYLGKISELLLVFDVANFTDDPSTQWNSTSNSNSLVVMNSQGFPIEQYLR